MNLRPYQSEALAEIRERLREPGSSTLLVLPTGGGKTIVFGHLIREWTEGRVLVLAHRQELIYQAADKIERVTGEPVDIEMADLKADSSVFRRAKCVVATVQTMNAGRVGGRVERFDPSEFGLIITDEAHHGPADSYLDIYDHFRKVNPAIRHLGVTATPDRHDEEALGQVYDTVAYTYEIADAVHDGWLVPVVGRTVTVEGLDFSGCKTTAGDLNGRDLAEVMNSEAVLHQIASATLEEARWRRTLIFAPPGFRKPDHEGGEEYRIAERLEEIIDRHKPGKVGRVHMATPNEERRTLLRRFAAGELQYMVNVGVLTEGFDDPGIECIVLARPTKSRALFAQMLGRGTRPLTGTVDGIDSDEGRCAAIAGSRKKSLLAVGFHGILGRHKLITPVDILGGNYSDEVRTKAEALVRESGQQLETEAALRMADHAVATEHEKARRRTVKATARYSAQNIDVFDVLGVEPWEERTYDEGRRPSDRMMETLKRNGVEVEGLSWTAAKQLIGEIIARRQRGLCTMKQARILKRNGMDTNVTFEAARAAIDGIAARQGWGRKRQYA